MKDFITISKVLPSASKTTKSWVIIRCDEDETLAGMVTSCGMPGRAKDFPVGTTFETKLSIPEEN